MRPNQHKQVGLAPQGRDVKSATRFRRPVAGVMGIPGLPNEA
jgi:hypothetical protein